MGLKKKSVYTRLGALKSFFKFLRRREVIRINPAKHIPYPKLPWNLVEFLKEREASRLMLQPNTATFFGKRDRAILGFLFSMRIRCAELISILIEDFNFDTLMLIMKGKGKKERPVFPGKVTAFWMKRI